MAVKDNPRKRFEKEMGRLDRSVENGDVTDADGERIKELMAALDRDNPAYVYRHNGSTETKETSTIRNYLQRLRLAATAVDRSLLELETDDVNQLMSQFATGEHPIAPDDGYADNTLGQYQSSLKAYYRYFDDHSVDPEEIPVAQGEETSIDHRDMFTEEEIQAMRDAITDPRNRCLFELLAYTGQRIRAIQTLRIRDVDVQEGVFWLNDDADGLKGASGKRPLLGAREYVHQWLEYHPTGEPDDYLITPTINGGGEPGTMISQSTIRYQLKNIADKAGVEKDVHPHIFRHYFTTIAVRDYNMDEAYVKRLRGDSPGSNVMETTYSHLTDDDAVQHARGKAGEIQPEDNSPLTPKVCPTCQSHLDPDAKACSRCGSVFTPDAKSVKEDIQSTVQSEKDQADTLEEHQDIDKLERIVNENPEVLDVLEEMVSE